VRIHEAGRKRGIAEIDDLRFIGHRQVAPGAGNGVALDDNDTVRQERFGFAVEKPRGFESDNCWRRRIRGKDSRQAKEQSEKKEDGALHPAGIERRTKIASCERRANPL
jgi:hypothetical protein